MTADGTDRPFGAPGFDVVLRGYDRRQVDEHLSRLNRVLARMRADLEAARSRPGPPPGLPTGGFPAPGPPTPAAGRPRPTPRRRPDGSGGEPSEAGADVVGSFTERMRTILQAAEEEAAEIRARAHAAARAERERVAAVTSGSASPPERDEADAVRAELEGLVRQRDAVLADLVRVRGQLEALLSGPTARIAVPVQGAGAPREPAPAPPPATAAPGERTTVTPAAEHRAAGRGAVPDGPAPGGPPGAEASDRPTALAPRVPAGPPVDRTAVLAPPVREDGGPSDDVGLRGAGPTGTIPDLGPDAEGDGAPPGPDATVQVSARPGAPVSRAG